MGIGRPSGQGPPGHPKQANKQETNLSRDGAAAFTLHASTQESRSLKTRTAPLFSSVLQLGELLTIAMADSGEDASTPSVRPLPAERTSLFP